MPNKALWIKAYRFLLSPRLKERFERWIIRIAILSFVLHLILIGLAEVEVISREVYPELLSDPINAIYTPFSFILFYEVYSLIYYIPSSLTYYIGKQYEIITLIVIRRIFKDLSHIKLSANWIANSYNQQFILDVTTTLILFFLIYLFYRAYNPWLTLKEERPVRRNIKQFIVRKKMLATALVPAFLALAVHSFFLWITNTIKANGGEINLNQIFFNEFFILLILSDVFLLLLSLFSAQSFQKLIRNAGFVITTIMIRLSFLSEGIVNNALIVSAVAFGLFILLIHQAFEKLEHSDEDDAPSP